MKYRHTTVTTPFPEDFSEENMKLVFMGIIQRILDSSGTLKPVAHGITVVHFLDANGKPWLSDEDDPGLYVRTRFILEQRFDLLKRSLDLRTSQICRERNITNLRRMVGIKEAGIPYPTNIRVSMPVALSYTQEIDFVRDAKITLEDRGGKAEITWESNEEDIFEPTLMTIAGKVYKVFHSDANERLEALKRGELP